MIVCDGYRLTRTVTPPTEADVTRAIDALREQHVAWSPVPDALATGDRVRLTIGFGESTPYTHHGRLGDPDIDPALNRVVSAMRVGETTRQTITTEERPRTLDVTVTVEAAERATWPTLTNEFIQRVTPFASLARYRAALWRTLWRSAEAEADQAVRRHLLEAVALAHSTLPVDADAVETLAVRHMPPDATESTRAIVRRRATEQTIVEAVLDQIADAEGITATDDDVADYVEQQVARSREHYEQMARVLAARGDAPTGPVPTIADAVADIAARHQEPAIRRTIARERALALILARNAPTKTAGVA